MGCYNGSKTNRYGCLGIVIIKEAVMKKVVFGIIGFFTFVTLAFATGTKISDMPTASSVNTTDTIPIVQGGVNKKATASAVANTISASEILTKIKTVDGSGSGLDADTLDGYTSGNGGNNIPINNNTLNENLNADLLDGQHGSYYQPVSTAITSGNIGDQTVSAASNATGTGSIPKMVETGTRIIRGYVNADGTTALGSGFTVTRSSTGTYVIHYSTAFTNNSVGVVTTYHGYSASSYGTASDLTVHINQNTAYQCSFTCSGTASLIDGSYSCSDYTGDCAPKLISIDEPFSFIVIGK